LSEETKQKNLNDTDTTTKLHRYVIGT
jgi:hypothetical protein